MAEAGFMLAALLMFIAIGASWQCSSRLMETEERGARARAVILHAENLVSQLMQAESGQRGFIITGERRFLEPCEDVLKAVEGELAFLYESTLGNPRQQQRIETLKPLVTARLESLRESADPHAKKSPDGPAQSAAILKDLAVSDNIRLIVRDLQKEEDAVLASREHAVGREAARSRIIALSAGGPALVLFFFAASSLRKERLQSKGNAGRAMGNDVESQAGTEPEARSETELKERAEPEEMSEAELKEGTEPEARTGTETQGGAEPGTETGFDASPEATVISAPLKGDGSLVLVCDTSPLALHAFRDLIQRCGYRVTVASGSKECLAKAEAFCPRAVFLSPSDPNLDGRATLRALLENPRTRKIPVVLAEDHEAQEQASAPGARAWVKKPESFLSPGGSSDFEESIAALLERLILKRQEGCADSAVEEQERLSKEAERAQEQDVACEESGITRQEETKPHQEQDVACEEQGITRREEVEPPQ
jgi:CHASE3 domain sensor protein/DNA-binding NarL/FixJ family response regulator